MEPVERGGFIGFELGADGGGGEYLWYPGSGSRHFEDPDSFVKMNGREVFKFATRIMVYSAHGVLEECGKTVEDVDVYIPHQANKRIIDYAADKLGIPTEKTVVNVDRFGNTSSGSIPLALADARAEGRLHDGALVLMTGHGRRAHVGLRAHRVDEREGRMSKVAFCFPGQGSLEEGMGREIAEAFPAARDVYRVGSEATGLDLEELCFATPLEKLVDTEVQQPALVATSLAILAAMRERGLEPDVVVGHSVGEFAALAAAGAVDAGTAIGLVRERGLAMAEAARQRPGAMAAILGLADEEVEKLCRRIVGVWPANYNCPGQIVVSGEHEAVEECCAEAASLGARRAVMLKVSGAFHSPLVARAADRLRPALDKVRFSEPLSPFMSTVTAKIEPAQKIAALLVDQLTGPVRFTQAATELIRSGATTFVEVGPGNVLSGLVKRIDRGVKTISVNSLESLERAQEALAR